MTLTINGITRWTVASLAWLGGYCLLTRRFRGRNTARILCYHGINDTPTNPYAISVGHFERQMQFLAEWFTVLSMDHLVYLLNKGKPLPPKTIAITIDDGFQDAYTHAYPILKRLALPATLFIPVDLVDSNQLLDNPLPQSEFLSWDQIREMSRNGISFGSHALTHTSLVSLTEREIQYQLEKSKAVLEHKLGRHVNGFAYPYGTFRDINIGIQALVTATGYTWAVSSISGVNHQGTNLLALKRTKVERGDGMLLFRHILQGALDPWVLLQAGAGAWRKVAKPAGLMLNRDPR